MKTVLARLIRAPIAAIVLAFGILAMVPVEAQAFVIGKNMPAMDRAAPAQIGMEYSDQAAIDQVKEIAIGEPVARAGPIMMSALNVRYEESTSHVLTIGHDLYAKNANFSATLIARANGSPPSANEQGSAFATSNDPADETSVRATARNGSQRMMSSS